MELKDLYWAEGPTDSYGFTTRERRDLFALLLTPLGLELALELMPPACARHVYSPCHATWAVSLDGSARQAAICMKRDVPTWEPMQ